MKIKIICDNEVLDSKFRKTKGLAYLIEDRVLFDTGERFDDLEHNAGKFGVDLAKVHSVIISHDHPHHTGGLWELLKRAPGITVYSVARLSNEFKEKVLVTGVTLIEVKALRRVDNRVYASGGMLVNYNNSVVSEQVAVLDSGINLTVICGCAHPGIVNILEKIKTVFNKEVHMVIGGFHMFDQQTPFTKYVVNQLSGLVKRIGPSHCTGQTAAEMLKTAFGGNCLLLKAGMEIEV